MLNNYIHSFKEHIIYFLLIYCINRNIERVKSCSWIFGNTFWLFTRNFNFTGKSLIYPLWAHKIIFLYFCRGISSYSGKIKTKLKHETSLNLIEWFVVVSKRPKIFVKCTLMYLFNKKQSFCSVRIIFFKGNMFLNFLSIRKWSKF